MITNEWYMGKINAPQAMEIRKKVFVDELGFSVFSEFDNTDDQAMHLVISVDGNPAATGRIYYDYEHRTFRVGRYCVLKEYRGQGIGDLTFKLLLYKVFEYCDKTEIVILPEKQDYYERFGFTKKCEEYADGHVPHIRMILKKEDLVYPSSCGKNK